MMEKHDFYLAHPFDSRFEMRKWELGFEKRTGIQLLNPFYDAEDRTDIEQIDAGRQERYEKLDSIKLVERDVGNIAKCKTGTIAIITGQLSYGTIMEIVYSRFVLKKIVYLVVTNGHENHPWLKYHSSKIFTALEGLEEFLVDGKK